MVCVVSVLEDDINQYLEHFKTCKLREKSEEQRAGLHAVPCFSSVCSTAGAASGWDCRGLSCMGCKGVAVLFPSEPIVLSVLRNINKELLTSF